MVRLDDTTLARRTVVSNLIHDMMDTRKSAEVRESALAWSRSLQNSLIELVAEEEQRQLYKPGQ
jgi:hypothetical protein